MPRETSRTFKTREEADAHVLVQGGTVHPYTHPAMGELYEVRYGVVLHTRYEPKIKTDITIEQQIEYRKRIIERDHAALAHIRGRLAKDTDPKVLEVLRGELEQRLYFTDLDEKHLVMLERKLQNDEV